MREVTRNFAVGLVSIIGLLGLAAMLMLFGELDLFAEPRYPLIVRFNNAAGLVAGSNVQLDGVRVGAVSAVTVNRDAQFPVRIETLIDNTIDVPVGVVPSITAALIGGGSTLSLTSPELPPDSRVDYLPRDCSVVIEGRYQTMIDQVMATLDARMKPLVEALEGFQSLGNTYASLGQNLNDLVRLQTPEEMAAGEPPNLRTAVTKLNAGLDDAREALKLAKEWLGDEQLRADARSAIAKAGILIDKATASIEHYTQLADTFTKDGGELLRRLLPVTDQLDATLAEVRQIASLALSGKGTIGQMLSNPDLYKSLNDAAVRLERALADAQLLIQKIKSEGLPINW
jgi:phospholipid/cholesterol/gamma-HCH transport system substrate-binding protein